MRNNIIIILLSFAALGCSSVKKSTLLGTVIGGSLGASMGNQGKNQPNNRNNGALIGAALGGLIGYSAGKDKQKKLGEVKKDDKANKKKFTPFMTRPDVRMYWVPDQISGNKYIEKHRVWVIKNPSTWSK